MSKRQWLAATGGIAVAVIVAWAVVAEAMSGSSPARQPTAALSVTIEGSRPGRPLGAGFLGLSFELPGLSAYTGLSQNPVLEQLIRQLAPGQAPVLRLGGDTTDMTWWPVRGMRRPSGVTFTLTPQWLQSTRQLAQALDAHLIIGVDLEANRRALAAAEARALVAGIGREHVEALEIGNEPNVYAIRPWYITRANRPARGDRAATISPTSSRSSLGSAACSRRSHWRVPRSPRTRALASSPGSSRPPLGSP